MSCHDVQNSEAHRQRSKHRTIFVSMLNIRDKCKQSYAHDNENYLHPSVSQAHDENPPVLDGRNKHPGQERCYQINVPFMFVSNSLYAWHRRLIRVFDGSIHLQGSALGTETKITKKLSASSQSLGLAIGNHLRKEWKLALLFQFNIHRNWNELENVCH